MTEIDGQKPYENTGLQEGDLIISVDNTRVSTTDELVECVNSSKGNILELTYLRNGVKLITKIEPAITANKEYKLRPLGKRWRSGYWYNYLL